MATSPPCVSHSGAVSSDIACRPCAENTTYSRAKRRRLRDRAVAVRHAVVHSRKLREHLKSQGVSTVDHVLDSSGQQPPTPSVSNATNLGKLNVLVQLLEQVLPLLQRLLFQLGEPGNVFGLSWLGEWEPAEESEIDLILQSLQRKPSFTFRREAPEFTPAAVRTEPTKSMPRLGDFRRLPESAWASLHQRFGARDHKGVCPVPPIRTEVANSSPFSCGDVVLIANGALKGHVGAVTCPGNDFNISEMGSVTRFRSLCSVKLDNDPHGFTSRLIDRDDLEKFEVTRQQLHNSIDGCLKAMEAQLIPAHCHEMMTPLLRKAMAVAKDGDPTQCKTMEQVLSGRLTQLAEDIFKSSS